MERGTWTEERLDDLIEGMRSGFARTDQDIRDLRSETREEFRALRAEMNAHFDTHDQRFDAHDQRFDALNQRIDSLHQTMLGLGGLMILGFLGVVATILTQT